MTGNKIRKFKRPHRAGSAMIMVLLILGVLIVISFPFLTSMVRHAENARSYKAETQSNQLADLGTQSASGLLVNGEVNQEWQRRNAVSPNPDSQNPLTKWPFITPYMDYSGELRIMRTQLAKYFLELDGFQARSSNSTFGIQIEDEQGKLNLTSAPDRVLNNLKSMVGPSERIEQYVTRHSIRPTSRSITKDRRPNQNSNVQTGEELRWVSTRHPININTAHWKVIAANLIDLGEWNGEEEQDEDTIGKTIKGADEFDQSTTEKIAKLIKAKTPINGWYQFKDVLDDADDEEIISGTQKKLILKNARKGNLLYNQVGVKRNTSMPFCFRSYDRYTVQSRSTTLNRTGSPLSNAGSRNIVITSPGPTSHLIKSPYEFAESLAQLTRSQGIHRKNSYGVILGPRKIYRKQQKNPSFDDNELGTWSNTDTLKDRGTEAYIQPRPNDRGKYKVYGKKVEGGFQEGDLVPTGSGYKENSTEPGGVKFWIKFNGTPSSTSLFDTAEDTYQSRIHLYYEDGKLYLDVADPTLEKKYTRIVANWQPQPDTWYHLGAFWKSTKYGHLALMIDGHLVGEMKMVDEDDQDLLQTISGSLSESGSVSQLSSLTPGYWELGEEIIEVSGRNLQYTSGGDNRAMGRKVTTPHDHSSASVASPYGFSIPLRNTTVDIPVGSLPHNNTSSLSADLSGIPQFQIRTTSQFGPPASPEICPDQYQEQSGNTTNCNPPEDDTWTLDTSTQTIPVIFDSTEDPSDLPSPALLIIYGSSASGGSSNNNSSNNSGQNQQNDYEVVVCDDASNNELTNCTRGALGSQPVEWTSGATVKLLGFPVNTTNQFPTNNNEGRIVQVDTEWMGPVKPHNADGTTFLGSTDKEVPLQREVLGTSIGANQTHPQDRRVLPVFALEEEEPEERFLADGLTMLEDVTLAYQPQNTLRKERVTIRLAKFSRGESVAALHNVAPDDVQVQSGNRLLKFPSGELIAESSTSGSGGSNSGIAAHIGSSSPNAQQLGSMSGTIANLESVDGATRYRLLDESIDDSSSTVVVRNTRPNTNSNNNPLQPAGAMKVGNELIGFAQTTDSMRPINTNSSLEVGITEQTEVTRGYLESTKNSHNRGDRVFVLSKGMISVSALENPINAQEGNVNVQNSGIFTNEYAYYRIGDEILGLRGGRMPEHSRTNQGLFRGAFGTTPAAHPENAMVFRSPHRYPDRVPENMTPELYEDIQFHVVSANRPDATWTGLSWEVERTQQQGSAPRLLVRADDDTDWDKVEKRYNPTKGSSIQFNEITDRLELLFLFDYQDGAYSVNNWRSQHGWKTTSRVRQLNMKYRLPSRTFLHRQIK